MSAYRELMARMMEEHVLLSVMLELTYRCNLDCTFCYNDLGVRGRQVETADYLRLLDEMAALQVLNVTLTGGEPLASAAFWPVGRRARELGFLVRVKSNGHALRRPVARRLRDEVDPYLVEVSLHGSRAATHDRQTRVAGSFERLVENLGVLREEGLRVKINCTLTRWNQDELEEMFALADSLEVPLTVDPMVTPRDDGDRGPLELSASDDAVRRLLDLVHARAAAAVARGEAPEAEIGRHNDIEPPPGAGRTTTTKSCGAGAATVTIDPFGNVYPCVQWRRSVGNVHVTSLGEIWLGGRLGEVRDINRRAGEMLESLGPRGRQIGFCLGMAEELAGDPLAMYPQAKRNLALVTAAGDAARETSAASRAAAPRRSLLPVYGQD